MYTTDISPHDMTKEKGREREREREREKGNNFVKDHKCDDAQLLVRDPFSASQKGRKN